MSTSRERYIGWRNDFTAEELTSHIQLNTIPAMPAVSWLFARSKRLCPTG